MRSIVISLVIMMILTHFSWAVYYEGGKELTVAPAETLKQDLFFFGDKLNMQGVVTGDVYMTGRRAEIDGEIGDDLLTFARRVVVTGVVRDGVLFFGEELVVKGTVWGDIRSFGKKITIEPGAHIHGNVYNFSAYLHMNGGQIDGSLQGAGGTAWLNGHVKKDVDLRSREVAFGKKFQGEGRVKITLEKKTAASIPNAPPNLELSFKKHKPFYKRTFQIWMALAELAIGFILLLIFPHAFQDMVALFRQKPLVSVGVGALFTFFMPVVIVLAITLLPLAFMLGGIYLSVLYLTSIFAAILTGNLLFFYLKQGKTVNPYLAYLVGFIIIYIFLKLPVIGFLVKIVVVLTGAGALLLMLWNRYRGTASVDTQIV